MEVGGGRRCSGFGGHGLWQQFEEFDNIDYCVRGWVVDNPRGINIPGERHPV